MCGRGFPEHKAELKPLGSLFWKQDELEILAESWGSLPCPQKTPSTFTWTELVFPIGRERAELSKKGRSRLGGPRAAFVVKLVSLVL